MCKKDAYIKTGGHEFIRASISDDIDLIRNFKKSGAKVLVCLGNELVECRMYSGYKEARLGFGRSLYRTIGNAGIFSIYLSLVISLFILPFVFAIFDARWLIIIGLIVLHRVITSIIYHQNIFLNTLLHLPQMFVQIDLALYSLYLSKSNTAKWKGRTVS
jgi:chlorobactene glucosyltransferase